MPPSTCTKCGELLIGSGRFCASCGAPAHATSPMVPAVGKGQGTHGGTLSSASPPQTKTTPPNSPPAQVPQSPPTRASSYGPPPPNPSGYAPPTPYAGAPLPPGYPQPPPGYAPFTPPPPGYPGYAPPGAPYTTSAPVFTAGTRVLVQWADGNRYPGVVQQLAPGQSLILFPDGQQRWVENIYLSMAL